MTTEQIETKLNKLQKEIYQTAKSTTEEVTKSLETTRNDHLYYSAQLLFAEECNDLSEIIRSDPPTNKLFEKRAVFEIIPQNRKKTDLFSDLNNFCRPVYLNDKLPPHSSTVIPISPYEPVILSKINLPDMPSRIVYERPILFTNSDVDQSSEVSTVSSPQKKQSSISLSAQRKRSESAAATQIVIETRPLNISIDADTMVVKEVHEGVSKLAGLKKGDFISMVNCKPSSMRLLAEEKLPLKLRVFRSEL